MWEWDRALEALLESPIKGFYVLVGGYAIFRMILVKLLKKRIRSIIPETMGFLLSVIIVIASSFVFTQRNLYLDGKSDLIRAIEYFKSITRGSFWFLLLLAAALHIFIFRKQYKIIRRKFTRLILRNRFPRFLLFEAEALLNSFLLIIAATFSFISDIPNRYFDGTPESHLEAMSWVFYPLIVMITHAYIIKGFGRKLIKMYDNRMRFILRSLPRNTLMRFIYLEPFALLISILIFMACTVIAAIFLIVVEFVIVVEYYDYWRSFIGQIALRAAVGAFLLSIPLAAMEHVHIFEKYFPHDK